MPCQSLWEIVLLCQLSWKDMPWRRQRHFLDLDSGLHKKDEASWAFTIHWVCLFSDATQPAVAKSAILTPLQWWIMLELRVSWMCSLRCKDPCTVDSPISWTEDPGLNEKETANHAPACILVFSLYLTEDMTSCFKYLPLWLPEVSDFKLELGANKQEPKTSKTISSLSCFCQNILAQH